MDKRSRAWKLYQKGLALWPDSIPPTPKDQTFLMSFAVMIDAATSKGKSAQPLHDPEAVQLVDTLLQVAGDKIDGEVFDKKWYKLAEWRMREVGGMNADSAFVVAEFLASGGWKGKTTPTVEQVLKYFPDLMKQAEEAGTHDPRWNV